MKLNKTASGIGGAVLGALSTILVLNPGNVTTDEIVKVDTAYQQIEKVTEELVKGADPDYEQAIGFLDNRVKNFRELLTEAYLYDQVPVDDPPPPDVDSVFLSGDYAHLGAVEPLTSNYIVWNDFTSIHKGCWNSDDVCVFPTADWDGVEVIFNNGEASWGEHGPKWGDRTYNATGTVRNLTMHRSGDWTQGREGHGIYWNAWRDCTFENVNIIEGGGQAWQLVWRASETLISEELWQNELHTVTFRNCSAIDNGQINFGSAVRASYPISFFNPGQSLVIDGLVIECEFPPYFDEGRNIQSHGGVFIGPGQQYRRTPNVTIDGLRIDIVASDRGELTLWAIDQGTVNAPYIVDQGGTADVKIVDDCGPIDILNTLTPLSVGIYKTHPHKPASEVHQLAVGQSLHWDGQGVTIE